MTVGFPFLFFSSLFPYPWLLFIYINDFMKLFFLFKRNVRIWLQYAEMEMRNKNVNSARNIWERAVTLLPRYVFFLNSFFIPFITPFIILLTPPSSPPLHLPFPLPSFFHTHHTHHTTPTAKTIFGFVMFLWNKCSIILLEFDKFLRGGCNGNLSLNAGMLL